MAVVVSLDIGEVSATIKLPSWAVSAARTTSSRRSVILSGGKGSDGFSCTFESIENLHNPHPPMHQNTAGTPPNCNVNKTKQNGQVDSAGEKARA